MVMRKEGPAVLSFFGVFSLMWPIGLCLLQLLLLLVFVWLECKKDRSLNKKSIARE
jgi:hypothetical protein